MELNVNPSNETLSVEYSYFSATLQIRIMRTEVMTMTELGTIVALVAANDGMRYIIHSIRYAEKG